MSTKLVPIPIEQVKRKYPNAYLDLLRLLDVKSYNKLSLKLAGIRSVDVFSINKVRYFCYLCEVESNPCASLAEIKAEDGEPMKDCYLLNVTSFGSKTQMGKSGSEVSGTLEEKMEFLVRISDRKASFCFYTGDVTDTTEALAEVFVYSLYQMVNIDITTVRVLKEDKQLLRTLCSVGFYVEGEDNNFYIATKNINEKEPTRGLLLH